MRTMAAAAPACATQRRIQKLRSCIYGTPAPPAAAVNQLLEAGCKRRKQLVWALPSAEGEKELFCIAKTVFFFLYANTFFSDVGPGSPRPTSPVPTIVLPMFGARHRALAPINRLQPADAGVCASRSGGGTSDNRTLPEYSPRPACDGGGHCATAGTPTQNAAYACGV